MHPTLAALERVLVVLDVHQVPSALIGATALAVHGYPRATNDLDLATACDVGTLHAVANALRAAAFQVTVHEPGPVGEDPLDGVLQAMVHGAQPIEIVNMRSTLGRETIATATSAPGLPCRVADLAHLVALKLKAGGPLDRRDVQELLLRNATIDRDALREVCMRFRVSRRFDSVVADLARAPEPEDDEA